MTEPLGHFSVLFRARAALSTWIASFESLVDAGDALGVSKATAYRLKEGTCEPTLEVFLAACVHERDRNLFSALFEGLVGDLRGVHDAAPLRVESNLSREIGEDADLIARANTILRDGRADAGECAKLVPELRRHVEHAQQLLRDLCAKAAAA